MRPIFCDTMLPLIIADFHLVNVLFCFQTVLCVLFHLQVVFVLVGFEQDSCNTVVVLV
jgi:hypothetical protein